MKRISSKPRAARITQAALTLHQFHNIAYLDSPERAHTHFALQSGLYSLRQVSAAIREYQAYQLDQQFSLVDAAERIAECEVR